MNKKKLKVFIIVLLLMLFIDQFVKYLVINSNIEFSIIKDILIINYEKNYGIAFSMFENKNIITIIVSFILIIYLIYLIYKEFIKKKKYTSFLNVSLSILLAGILGNLIDRIRLGFVVDYIDLSFFAIFNLADIFITYGILILLYKFIKE